MCREKEEREEDGRKKKERDKRGEKGKKDKKTKRVRKRIVLKKTSVCTEKTRKEGKLTRGAERNQRKIEERFLLVR